MTFTKGSVHTLLTRTHYSDALLATAAVLNRGPQMSAPITHPHRAFEVKIFVWQMVWWVREDSQASHPLLTGACDAKHY